MIDSTLADRLRKLCSNLYDLLARELADHVEVIYGPDVGNSDIPEVLHQRARGVQFWWVAMPVPPFVFWDLHVGVVIDPETLLARTGIHRRFGASETLTVFEDLETRRAEWSLSPYDSVAAEEIQFIAPARDMNDPGALRESASEAQALWFWVTSTLAASQHHS